MPRFLHTSIFVNDMDESIDFYTNKMGLKLLGGPHHYPGNADMAFVGSSWDAYVELVYDLEEHPPYALGNRYEHLALEVDGDLPAVVERLRAQGVKIVKEPKKSPGGTRCSWLGGGPSGMPGALLVPSEGAVAESRSRAGRPGTQSRLLAARAISSHLEPRGGTNARRTAATSRTASVTASSVRPSSRRRSYSSAASARRPTSSRKRCTPFPTRPVAA